MKKPLEKPFTRGGTWQRLPLHPHPAPFETLTSYVTRLAKANRLTIAELAALAETGSRWQLQRNAPDLLINNALGLLPLTGCTRADLEKTTFALLGQCFGAAYSPLILRRFLHRSLAPSWRYCPMCLAEDPSPYYRLSWRFLTLIGCSTHFCHLLDHCDHCRTPLPHHPHHLPLTHCSTCNRDLRTLRSTPSRVLCTRKQPTNKQKSEMESPAPKDVTGWKNGRGVA